MANDKISKKKQQQTKTKNKQTKRFQIDDFPLYFKPIRFSLNYYIIFIYELSYCFLLYNDLSFSFLFPNLLFKHLSIHLYIIACKTCFHSAVLMIIPSISNLFDIPLLQTNFSFKQSILLCKYLKILNGTVSLMRVRGMRFEQLGRWRCH